MLCKQQYKDTSTEKGLGPHAEIVSNRKGYRQGKGEQRGRTECHTALLVLRERERGINREIHVAEDAHPRC